MKKLFTFLSPKWLLGLGILGAASYKFSNNIIYMKPIDPESLQNKNLLFKKEIRNANLNFMKKYGFSLPRLNPTIENNTYRVSFEFTAPQFNHLKAFNKLLEAYHSYKHLVPAEIKQTHREIKGDLVIYKFEYYTIDKSTGNKENGTAYLIGNVKQGTYRVSLEKENGMGNLEFWLIFHEAGQCPNLTYDEEINEKDEEGILPEKINLNHALFVLLKQFGFDILEIKDNNFTIENAFGKENMQKIINEIMSENPTSEKAYFYKF